MYQQNQPSKFICSIKLYFDDAQSVPVPLFHPENNLLGMYQTLVKGTTKKVRQSRVEFSVTENFSENRSGGFYSHRINFKAKNTSKDRAINLQELRKVRFIGLIFSDGTEHVIGNNDRIQNIKPELSHTSNENFTEVSFSCNSLLPIPTKYTINNGYTFTYPFIYF